MVVMYRTYHHALPLALALLTLGCGGRAARLDAKGSIEPELELLWEGETSGAAPAPTWRAFFTVSPSLYLLEPGASAPDELDDGGLTLLDAAVVADGDTLLATTEGVWTLVEEGDAIDVRGSGLDGYTGAVERLGAWGRDTWLGTDTGLFVARNGWITEIRVDDQPASGPFALGGTVSERDVVWVSGGFGVAALETKSGAFEPLAWRHGEAPDSMAVDGSGTLWAASEGELVRGDEDGSLRRYALPEAVLSVFASPETRGAWVHADGALYHANGEDLYRVQGADDLIADLGAAAAARADELGRLLVPTSEGLYRLAEAPTLLVVGLQDGDELDGTVELTFVPTRPDDVTALSADIDGVALTVEGDASEGWTATLDASAWLDGEEHALASSATYEDGTVVSSGAISFLSTALGDVNWKEHIEPIYDENCAVCHGGATETLLDTPELWQERIDDIIVNVSSGAMPLGRDPLTELQVAIIEAWRDGGFVLE